MSRVLHLTRHKADRFEDVSFQAITCIGTNKQNQTHKTNKIL